MYQTCPKCGATAAAGAPADRCAVCGVIYAKWLRAQLGRANASTTSHGPAPGAADDEDDGFFARLWDNAVYVEQDADPWIIGGRGAVWFGLLIWTFWFFGTDYKEVFGGFPEMNTSFMHTINLVFHEAGHIIFILLGEFMGVLGGSLAQLMMPAAVVVAFLVYQNPFGSSVGLWWLGQSAMDLAPYIADARAGQVILLGGVTGNERPGFHDWEVILSWLGWMQHDHAIAGVVDGLGRFTMVAALVWGGWLVYKQFHLRAR
ncbi:MAG: zinc ribbon domain-containing protein [Pseudomonadota bacterium]